MKAVGVVRAKALQILDNQALTKTQSGPRLGRSGTGLLTPDERG
jgi:hypothetical protein